jgi:rhomboid family GlyGly-CTERM serine protease
MSAGRLRGCMSAGRLRRSASWLLLCAVAVGGALAVAVLAGREGLQAIPPGASHAAVNALRWQPELALTEPWRCISAAWVHLSRQHLIANLGGSALVAALGVVAGCGRRSALAWALAWPLTHLGLLLQPTLTAYGGLSGLMHAGVAVACVQVIGAEQGERRWTGAALLAGLLTKLWLEAAWAGPLHQVPGWDIAIAPAAHASGVVAGLLCAGAIGVGRNAGWRGRNRP